MNKYFQVEKKIDLFLQDEKETRLKFAAMDQVYRGVM